jgi:L-lactate dehydrogenase complex protein LldG
VNTARDAILARLPAAAPAVAPVPLPADGRLAVNRANAPGALRLRRFVAAARSAAATVDEVRDVAGVGPALAAWLAAQGLAPDVWTSGEPPGLAAPPAGLRLVAGPMPADGATLVTGCLALLAEEGAVVLASGARHAAESAFLAATHVVVAPAGLLVDGLGDLWPLLRARGALPRTLNIVRGPSRTADLGVPSRLGAHGPLRVHVVLVGEDAG